MKRLLFLLAATMGASAMEPVEPIQNPVHEAVKKHYMLIDNQGWRQPLTPTQHMALMQCETYKDAYQEFNPARQAVQHNEAPQQTLNQQIQELKTMCDDLVENAQRTAVQQTTHLYKRALAARERNKKSDYSKKEELLTALQQKAPMLTKSDRNYIDFSQSAQPCTTKDRMLQLAQCIEHPEQIKNLDTDKTTEIFELADYLQAPSEVCDQLAEKFINQIVAKKDDELSTKEKILKNMLIYPTCSDFAHDFEQSGKDINKLLTISLDHYRINLSHHNFKRLGFRRKIASLQGLSKILAMIPDKSFHHSIDITGHAISDFELATFLENGFHWINLSNNKISSLYTKQLLPKVKNNTFLLRLDNNPIQSIHLDHEKLLDADYFHWGGIVPPAFAHISLQGIPLSSEQLQALPQLRTTMKKCIDTAMHPYSIGKSIYIAQALGALSLATKTPNKEEIFNRILMATPCLCVSIPATCFALHVTSWYQNAEIDYLTIETDHGTHVLKKGTNLLSLLPFTGK